MSVADRRQQERARRRDDILDAARRTFLAKGFEHATMGDVARQAQLGKGTLYLYFKTKSELLLGVATRHQQRVLARFGEEEARAKSGRDLIRTMLLAYAAHLSEPVEHLRMVMTQWARAERPRLDSDVRGKMRAGAMAIFGKMRSAVERGQQDGSIRRDIEAGRLCLLLWSSVNGALLMRLQHRCLPEPNPLEAAAPSLEEHLGLLMDALGRTGSADDVERGETTVARQPGGAATEQVVTEGGAS